jgi:uroporphyrinogen decarboxylase
MTGSLDLVRTALELGKPTRLPRGELWINSKVLEGAQLKDNLEGHLSLRQTLGMDLLSLPLSSEDGYNPYQGYHYFNLDDVRESVRHSDLFVMVVLDGPFQRLTLREGLMGVFGSWKETIEAFKEQCLREAQATERLIGPCLGAGIEAFVVADDLAYEQSTYFGPRDFEETLAPFYSTVVKSIHAGGARALFHSCGNIRSFVPRLRSSGFDGFAACQVRHLGRVPFPEEHPSVILGGIEAEHLESRTFDKEHQQQFQSSVQDLATGGGLILGSSCGLYKPEFLDRIKLLYELAEDRPLGFCDR